MIILKLISKVFKILTSNESPSQIAWAAVLGMILGLTPFWTLQQILVIFLIIILKVNITMAILSLFLFKGIAWMIDPLLHSIGFYLLVDFEALKTMWTSLYHAPVVPLTKFYNTVVLGAFVASLILLEPVFLFSKYTVVLYRTKLNARFQKLKIVKIIKSSGLYGAFTKFRKLGD